MLINIMNKLYERQLKDNKRQNKRNQRMRHYGIILMTGLKWVWDDALLKQLP